MNNVKDFFAHPKAPEQNFACFMRNPCKPAYVDFTEPLTMIDCLEQEEKMTIRYQLLDFHERILTAKSARARQEVLEVFTDVIYEGRYE